MVDPLKIYIALLFLFFATWVSYGVILMILSKGSSDL